MGHVALYGIVFQAHWQQSLSKMETCLAIFGHFVYGCTYTFHVPDNSVQMTQHGGIIN